MDVNIQHKSQAFLHAVAEAPNESNFKGTPLAKSPGQATPTYSSLNSKRGRKEQNASPLIQTADKARSCIYFEVGEDP